MNLQNNRGNSVSRVSSSKTLLFPLGLSSVFIGHYTIFTDYIFAPGQPGYIPLGSFPLIPPQGLSCLCLLVTAFLLWAFVKPTWDAIVLRGPLVSPAKAHGAASSFGQRSLPYPLLSCAALLPASAALRVPTRRLSSVRLPQEPPPVASGPSEGLIPPHLLGAKPSSACFLKS
jgi:hypothetical protein